MALRLGLEAQGKRSESVKGSARGVLLGGLFAFLTIVILLLVLIDIVLLAIPLNGGVPQM